ncbi:hypothetical protein CsSME_00019367 [Camellia sinensis var. sinensis]
MLSLSLVASERGFETPDTPCGCCEHSRDSSDLVALKISLLRDSQIGKTSFLASAFVFCFFVFFFFFVSWKYKVCWGREARRRI